MDKKEYMAPELETVELYGRQLILAGSDLDNGESPDPNYDDYD